MKTRTRKSVAAAKAKPNDVRVQAPDSIPKLEASVENPPHVTILPRLASAASRIITVPTCERAGHSRATRYFVDPEKGFYEFTKVLGSDAKTRSWLLAPTTESDRYNEQDESKSSDSDRRDGYLLSDPALLIATPIDPLFVLLAIDGAIYPAKNSQGRFMYSTLENRIWELKQKAPQLRTILDGNPKSRTQAKLESRIRSISDQDPNGCDGVEYCISTERLARELLKIARRMVNAGLPQSMEDRFVKQALDVPEQILKREDSTVSIVSDQDVDGNGQLVEESVQVPTDEVIHLLRIRVALQFLLTKYIRVELSEELQAHLKNLENGEIDFRPLDDRLEQIANLKAQAQALRSISDNISRKRGTIEDEESMERLETKKRKKEEEEAKKKSMSQGIKKLMKADTSGMKKLSSFFTKPAAKKP